MLLNSLCIIAGLIGYLISVILFINKKSNPIINIYLILLLFILSCRFFIYGISNLLLNQELVLIYTKYSNFTSIVIPIAYLYFKNLIDKKNFIPSDLLHFVFPILYNTLISNKIHNYFITNIFSKLLMYLLFVVFLINYGYLSYKLLKSTIWNSKGEYKLVTQQQKKVYNWTIFLFIVILLASLRLSISLFLEVYYNVTIRGLSYQWISSLIWIVLLIKILISPEILYGYEILNEKVLQNRNSKLKFNEIWKMHSISEIKNVQHQDLKEKINPNLQNYFEQIEKLSSEFEFFRNPNVTLNTLAIKLKIPKSHLSYLFKYHSKISFSEFKKMIRIHDAIQLIDNGYLKNNTLESLSKKIGFTSYNPFYTSFKEIIGLAPNVYIHNIENAI